MCKAVLDMHLMTDLDVLVLQTLVILYHLSSTNQLELVGWMVDQRSYMLTQGCAGTQQGHLHTERLAGSRLKRLY